jgi:ABC-type Na+ efflux pump permease subunit
MLEKTFCERIAKVFVKIVAALLEILCIDVEESITRLIAAEKGNKTLEILLMAIIQSDSESEKMKPAA